MHPVGINTRWFYLVLKADLTSTMSQIVIRRIYWIRNDLQGKTHDYEWGVRIEGHSIWSV